MGADGETWPRARRFTGRCRTRTCRRAGSRRRISTARVRALARCRGPRPLKARTVGSMMARRAHVACLAVLSASLVGCYTLQPAGGRTPEVGAKVAFDVNDAGRSALGGSLGPEISQIEGKLLEQQNGEYLW